MILYEYFQRLLEDIYWLPFGNRLADLLLLRANRHEIKAGPSVRRIRTHCNGAAQLYAIYLL